MDIEQLTIGEARQIAKMFHPDPLLQVDAITGRVSLLAEEHPWEIGKIYLIRTVTMIDTGRLVAVTPQELVLEDAAWIAGYGSLCAGCRESGVWRS